MSEESKVIYAVWPERGNLVRFKNGDAELFCPTKEGKDNWVSMPHLNEIRAGFGNSIWYDFIDETEAKNWMERIREEEK